MNAVFAEKGIVLPLTSGQTVTEESRLLDGIAAQKSIFGDHIDAMRAAAPENQKNIQDDLSAYCFGDFYTRKFLPIHERELLTFSILASQGGCEGQVKAHVGGNATVGNGKEVLLAALTVCLPYIGFPRTLNALSCIIETFLESYDFSGKTVIPFATSGGSGMGGEDVLRSACSKGTKWLPGKRLSSRESMASVQKWVESLGL